MKKTIKEWLEELPEPYRTQALNNADEVLLECTEETQSEALKGAFMWFTTEEGHDYWSQLHKTLKNHANI